MTIRVRRKGRSGSIGPVTWHVSSRTDERRLRSWCGLGPVGDRWHKLEDPDRHVCGFAVHAGRHLFVVTWCDRDC